MNNMKRIEELTEQEVLALTDADIEMIINLCKAEAGIKIINPPAPLTPMPIREPRTTTYTCELFGGDICFSDINELQRVISVIKECVSKGSINSDYNVGSDYKWVSPFMKSRGYSSNEWDTITSAKCYTKHEYDEIKDIIKANSLSRKGHEEAQAEYDSALRDAKNIREEVWDRVYEVREKYAKRDRMYSLLVMEYMPIAENNYEMALRFLDKAYSLTDEDKAWMKTRHEETND